MYSTKTCRRKGREVSVMYEAEKPLQAVLKNMTIPIDSGTGMLPSPLWVDLVNSRFGVYAEQHETMLEHISIQAFGMSDGSHQGCALITVGERLYELPDTPDRIVMA